MRVTLAASMKARPAAEDARRIVESCVHCGLCTAACPTYDLLDHELDSPRGRIYLLREVLQTGTASARTRQHLDRCLGCRACETACPSGVAYGQLLDLGRTEVEQLAPRPLWDRWRRRLLARVLTIQPLLRGGMALAWTLRPWLPTEWQARVPARPARVPAPAVAAQSRFVLVLGGCVQPVLVPGHDAALASLLAASGVAMRPSAATGCCGALDQHLGADDAARRAMRRNIDAWWPDIERGALAILVTSSGCGAMVASYAHLLRADPAYAEKARRVSELLQDPAQMLSTLWARQMPALRPLKREHASIAYQAPCTQQHGLKFRGVVERLLQQAGYTLSPAVDAQRCCGSAGTFSIFQPALAKSLRDRKLADLLRSQPACIASANVGCILHLQTGSQVPVRHWLELLADRLVPGSGA
jgi:glycolate oxidase iron-sulfur subunit